MRRLGEEPKASNEPELGFWFTLFELDMLITGLEETAAPTFADDLEQAVVAAMGDDWREKMGFPK